MTKKGTTIVVVLLCHAPAAWADYTGLIHPLDTPSSIGTAGISLLSLDSATALTENPGAIPFQRRTLEILSTTPLHERPQSRERQTSVARGAGAASAFPSHWGEMGIAAGIVNRELQNRFLASSSGSLGYELRDLELRGGLGVRLFDELGLGATLIYTMGEDRVRQWNPGQKIEEQTFSGLAIRLSSHARLGNLSGALAWQSDATLATHRRIVPFEGAQLGTPYKPARGTAALGYDFPAFRRSGKTTFLSSRLLGQLDVAYFGDLVGPVNRPGSRVYQMGYSLYVPWVPEENRTLQRLDTSPRFTPRGAIETAFVRTENLGVSAMVGAYLEPARTPDGISRFHNTAGGRVALWGFSAEAGCDFAEGYRNIHFGAGATIPME